MPHLRAIFLSAVGIAALLVAASEYLNLRAVDPDRPIRSLERLQTTQPWGGLAAREAARWLETRWRLDADSAAEALRWQLGRYPLDPWRWLLLARMTLLTGNDGEPLRRTLATAVAVQPGSRQLRWQAANLAQNAGDPDLILTHLKLWLADQPHMTDRALFIAERWVDDPDRLLDEVVPADDEFLAQAMRYARRSRSLPLAEATWQRLDHPRPAADRALADYVATALDSNRPDRAMAAWQTVDASYRPGDIPAGRFDLPLEALSALGWYTRVPDGVSLAIVPVAPKQQTSDPAQAPAGRNALMVRFKGEENIHMNTPFVRFPVPAPGRYRLTGWWRANGLTTRALPQLQLYAESPDHSFSATLAVPSAEFGWQPFAIPFETTMDNEILRFRLRRLRTDAFDRYIAGELMLADLGVEPALADGISGEESEHEACENNTDTAPLEDLQRDCAD